MALGPAALNPASSAYSGISGHDDSNLPSSKDSRVIPGKEKEAFFEVPVSINQGTMQKKVRQSWHERQLAGTRGLYAKGASESKEPEYACFARKERGMDITPDDHTLSELVKKIDDFSSYYVRKNIVEDTKLKIDGEYIDANYIYLRDLEGAKTGGPVAILSGYPFADRLEEYVKMLYRERPSVLVVLAESKEIGIDRFEYFKESLDFGRLQFDSRHCETLPPTSTSEFEMECYKASIWEDGGDKISLPILHVVNWEDGTEASVGQMAAVVEAMHSIQIKDGGKKGRPRVPLLHCRSGVGRSGQLAGTILLADKDEPYIRSVESLLKDLILSRGIWTAYVPQQKKMLGQIAAMRGIPILEEQRIDKLESILGHIGYVGFEVRPYEDILDVLKAEGCFFNHARMSWHYAESHLSQRNVSGGVTVLHVIRDGKIVRQIIWNPKLDKGLNTDSGEIFEGDPLAFWREKIGKNGISCDKLEAVYIFPSYTAGDIGIFTNESGEQIKNDMEKYWGGSEPQDIQEIAQFLKNKEIEAFYKNQISIDDLKSETRTFLQMVEILKNSRNVMLEFSGVGEDRAVRYTFKDLSDENRNCVGQRYSPPDGIQSFRFGSIDSIIDHIVQVADPGSVLDILSSDRLVGIDDWVRNLDDSDDESRSDVEGIHG